MFNFLRKQDVERSEAEMKSDQKEVHDLIQYTVIQLCEKRLLKAVSVQIRGVIGITVNDTDVFVVHINEDIGKVNSCQQLSSDVKKTVTSTIPDCPTLLDSQSGLCGAEAKKRLIFSQTNLKEESSTAFIGAKYSDSLPELTSDCVAIKDDTFPIKRQRCVSHEDEALVIVDSDEEENSLSMSNSETLLMDNICSPDEDCVMADPGVWSLRIASVTGSATRGKSRNEDQDSELNSYRSSPSMKRESLRQVVLQPVNSNNTNYTRESRESFQENDSSVSGHATHVKNIPATAQTPSKASRVFTTSTRRTSFIASTPPSGSGDATLTYSSATTMSHSTPRRKLPWKAFATNDSFKCDPNTQRSPTVVSYSSPEPASQSYRTMFVCNIGRCSRGFAYKKNLVKHQQDKHQ